ncbi:secreted protein [Fulvivirga imtechensis AK7]|uniref:Secreted protein n=1 Tax=Fulvivirga imtechensis AK7 TaxID=1237149 RepID=L8JUU7_9BACT|nr:hypothetical protein [Fulvivirga imtechensis]ELR72751.1 secreted protein [Fulvivirga imtechensis AK7]
MKKLLLLGLVISSYYNASAQSYYQQDSARLKKTVLGLNILLPGLTYEQSLTDKSSLFLNFAFGFAYEYHSSGFSSYEAYTINPTLLAQYRSYYNLARRQLLDRKTTNNTGSFFGMMAHYTFDAIGGKNTHAIDVENGLTLGPVWGFQRNGLFTFSLSLGLGVTIGEGQSSNVGPIGHLNFGINLSKKKEE